MWDLWATFRSCTQIGHHPQQPPVFRGWLSWKLRRWFLTIVILLEIGFIITIAILATTSRHHDGIASVSLGSTSLLSDISFSSLGSSQLCWTLIPAIAMALFLLTYNSIVSAVAVRQPFVELMNGSSGQQNMRTTVMLDYMTYPLFYSWAIAIRHKHIILGFSFLIQLLASISFVSLSANIFRAVPSHYSQNTSVALSQEFATDLLDSRTDLQPALNLAGAIHIDGAIAPSWMNNRYAFERFQPTEQAISGNFTAEVSGLSSSPFCRLVEPAEYTVIFEPSDGEGTGFTTVSFVDRGCNVTKDTDVASSTGVYAQSWYQQCRGEQYDRIGVLMGLYSSSSPVKLHNLTIVSCMPKYWNSTIALTMSINPSKEDTPQFVSAITKDTNEISGLSFDQIHRVLHLYVFFDPSAVFRADILGKTVYKYAQVLNPLSTLDSDAVVKAMEAVYETMFAALATNNLRRLRNSPSEAPAQVAIAVGRLYVNETVAWVVVAFLSAMLLSTIGLANVVRTTTSMLREEPKGLLAYARLLDGSDVLDTARLFQQRYPKVDDMREYIKKYYRKSMVEAKYYFDVDHGRIRAEGKGLESKHDPKPGIMHGQWWREQWERFGKWITGIKMKIESNLKSVNVALRKPGWKTRFRRQRGQTRSR